MARKKFTQRTIDRLPVTGKGYSLRLKPVVLFFKVLSLPTFVSQFRTQLLDTLVRLLQ